MEERKYGRTLSIKEQVIKDLVTGLTIVFNAANNGEGVVYLKGSSLPFGNREFQFSPSGELEGAGTGLTDCFIEGDNYEG